MDLIIIKKVILAMLIVFMGIVELNSNETDDVVELFKVSAMISAMPNDETECIDNGMIIEDVLGDDFPELVVRSSAGMALEDGWKIYMSDGRQYQELGEVWLGGNPRYEFDNTINVYYDSVLDKYYFTTRCLVIDKEYYVSWEKYELTDGRIVSLGGNTTCEFREDDEEGIRVFYDEQESQMEKCQLVKIIRLPNESSEWLKTPTERLGFDKIYLYDFDNDGIDEYLGINTDDEKVTCLIHKDNSGILDEMCVINTNISGVDKGIVNENTFEKYYDSVKDEYFYFSDCVFVENDWFYYEAKRYDMVDGELVMTPVCMVKGLYPKKEQLFIVLNYFNGTARESGLMEYSSYSQLYEDVLEYLEGFEKVEEIEFAELKQNTNDKLYSRDLEKQVRFDDSNYINCWYNIISKDVVEYSICYEQGLFSELKFFAECKNLIAMEITNASEKDVNLFALNKCENLRLLSVADKVDKISLKSLDQVEVLLGGVTADYADALKDMDNLKFVMLSADTDEADYFKFLAELPELEGVLLTSNVTDAQMEYIKKNMPWIEFVYRR